MNEKKILLVGECVLDIIQEVEEFPKEDADIRSTYGRWQRGGNASNNASVLTNLGQKCELLTTFSDSKMFDFVIEDLKARNIDIKNCSYHKNTAIPLSTVFLSKKTGSRTIIHSNKDLPHVNFDHFDKCDLNEYKWIHFEARNPEITTKMMLKIKEFNDKHRLENRIKISLDLEKKRNENLLLIKYADVAFLGKDYALLLGCTDMKSAVYTLKDMTSNNDAYKNDNVVIICPWGSLGACALHGDIYVESPAHCPEMIVDTLGAGDTFCAGCLYSLNKNFKDIPSAISFGCKLAGFKIAHYGYDAITNYESSKF